MLSARLLFAHIYECVEQHGDKHYIIDGYHLPDMDHHRLSIIECDRLNIIALVRFLRLVLNRSVHSALAIVCARCVFVLCVLLFHSKNSDSCIMALINKLKRL